MKFSKQALHTLALLAAVSPTKVVGELVPYATEARVYLDPATSGGANIDDTRWELSSAVGQTGGPDNCRFLRDFIFTCGWYDGEGWFCTASNNSVGNPKDVNSFQLPNQAGWYLFRHEFSVVNGALSVDFLIIDEAGTTLRTWTRSNPADVESILQGNRYGWFVKVGCTTVTNGSCTADDGNFKLAIDDTKKCSDNVAGCEFEQGFETDVEDWQNFRGGTVTRVSSGTDGIDSFEGSFHAQLTPGIDNNTPPAIATGPFGRWGGYCTTPEDLCPGSEPGVPVDENGCTDDQVDEDDDGVCDFDAVSTGPSGCEGIDRCPLTEQGAEVDENGCSVAQLGAICPAVPGLGKGGGNKQTGGKKAKKGGDDDDDSGKKGRSSGSAPYDY